MQLEDLQAPTELIEFSSIPDFKTWKRHRKRELFSKNRDGVLEEIDQLVQQCEKRTSMWLVFHLYLATDFWCRKVNRNRKTGDRAITGASPLHFAGHEGNRAAVLGLRLACRATLIKYLDVKTTFEAALLREFGSQNGPREDDLLELKTAAQGTVVYLFRDGEQENRHRYKLRFRDGLAYRWSIHEGKYCPYDTFIDDPEGVESSAGQMWGPGFRHFAIDDRGRIYSGFPTPLKFKFWHSSLIGGEDAFAAGVIQIRHGSVLAIVNDSGHYKPGAEQMITALRRLRLYGVETGKIRVYRHAESGGAVGMGDKEPDFCTGAELLAAGAWPAKMRIPKK